MPLRVANGAGFLGDWLDAPRRLVERAEVDFLTLEYLAELTLSILARQREKDPHAGYATDFLDQLATLQEALRSQPQLKIVTNGGGVNPQSCVTRVAEQLVSARLGATRLGLVSGDDLLPQLAALRQAGCEFRHFDTDEPFPWWDRVVSVHAYLGAAGIAAALAQEARVVITGRVADASLTVGPCLATFGSAANLDQLAGYSVAGHLIECGAQVTGGYSVAWADYELGDIGYPIAEIEADGSCVLTKPHGSGGSVNRRTVTEQLVYEIGDPRRYITPDVTCNFTSITLEDLGSDRVRVQGAIGELPPDDYKVSLAYRDGYQASGLLLVCGDDALPKAHAAADIMRTRMRLAGWEPQQWLVETFGATGGAPRPEIMLRVTMSDARRAAVERFTREVAPLITSGPAGLSGYAAGRPAVRPVYAYWPSRVPRHLVPWQVIVLSAQECCA
jgi:hypothetical protein